MTTDITSIIDGLNRTTADVQQSFGAFSGAQLNWKPSAEQWSIAQCLEHLITLNSDYFPIVERLRRDGYHPSLYQRMPILPGFFGSMVLKSVGPEGQRKFKAEPRFVPAASQLTDDIVRQFTAHQARLVEMMRSAEGLDLERTIITSPVAAVAIYSLFDAFRIIEAHERRHVAQAKRVMTSSGFP